MWYVPKAEAGINAFSPIQRWVIVFLNRLALWAAYGALAQVWYPPFKFGAW